MSGSVCRGNTVSFDFQWFSTKFDMIRVGTGIEVRDSLERWTSSLPGKNNLAIPVSTLPPYFIANAAKLPALAFEVTAAFDSAFKVFFKFSNQGPSLKGFQAHNLDASLYKTLLRHKHLFYICSFPIRNKQHSYQQAQRLSSWMYGQALWAIHPLPVRRSRPIITIFFLLFSLISQIFN